MVEQDRSKMPEHGRNRGRARRGGYGYGGCGGHLRSGVRRRRMTVGQPLGDILQLIGEWTLGQRDGKKGV